MIVSLRTHDDPHPRTNRGWWVEPLKLAAGLLAATTWAILGASAAPFTYQGRLVDNSLPAYGEYELRFRVYDAAVSGAQVGSDVSLPSVGVTNGLFTVAVDFGNSVFTGPDRYIELAARPKGSTSPIAVFSPRTAITAVPYALHAFSTPGDAATLTTGTLPDARLSLNIARVQDLNTSSNTLSDRVFATQADLQAQVNALSDRVAKLTAAQPSASAVVPTNLPAGLVIASPVTADLTLLSQGLLQFAKFEAPAWTTGATLNAPGARNSHGAVWTGSTMMVWGGINGSTPTATGGTYDPATDSWTTISTVNAPSARRGHAIAWTGGRLLVWGGQGDTYLGTGGSFSPTNQLWVPISNVGAPAERVGQAFAWTGARLFIWGGRNDSGLLGDGASYDPIGNLWIALPATDAPSARRNSTATWCGDRVIVWGGESDAGETDTGAAIPMAGGVTHGAWRALSTVNAPLPRQGHTAVWTGTRLIVWGGKVGGVPVNDGAAYDPVTDTWTALPTTGAASARGSHSTVWTGREMVVFGGEDLFGSVGTGAGYDPATGIWHPLSSTGGALPRRLHTGVWTGTELLVFGGIGSGFPATSIASVQRLMPEATWYLYRKP
jgi:hypothetical protein